MQRLAGLPIATEALATAAANTGSRIAAAESASRPRYRAVSWWLTFDDLAWPNSDLHDAIRRRADRCAASGVNCCIVFGAPFRWDFLPLWSRLHDLLRTVAAAGALGIGWSVLPPRSRLGDGSDIPEGPGEQDGHAAPAARERWPVRGRVQEGAHVRRQPWRSGPRAW